MKIGIVCYPTYGGSGVIATELGLALAKHGHNVHFITYQKPPRLNVFNENIYFHEVTVSDYPLFQYKPYDSVLAGKLVDIIEYEKLDLLHVHYAIPHASVAYLVKQICKERGKIIPVITTLHGTDITLVGKDASLTPVVEFSINHSDGVTTVSESLKHDTHANFKINKDIKVIYNFIDFEKFKKIDKDHFKKAIAPNNERLILHTSNFRKVKRVEDVIRVFEQLVKEVPSKLILIGDGPERSRLEVLCRELGLCNEIRFLGKQDAIEELLAVADLFLMPSETESFGLAALEAMACQVPVICTDSGGLPELVEHGVSGFLTDVGDIRRMVEYAKHILSSNEILARFSKEAFRRAQQFDINKILLEYEAYYQEVVEKTLKAELNNVNN